MVKQLDRLGSVPSSDLEADRHPARNLASRSPRFANSARPHSESDQQPPWRPLRPAWGCTKADRLQVRHLPSRPSHLANSKGAAIPKPSEHGEGAGPTRLHSVSGFGSRPASCTEFGQPASTIRQQCTGCLILNQTDNPAGHRAGLCGDARRSKTKSLLPAGKTCSRSAATPNLYPRHRYL
ncbi:hypothetical protein PGT21_020906 [Puccinia graminis f. sp. tritici]|uniref:Uncharacterized protein n=1 Tax=Puccinia graminis f. sp. tritici TaxID=56615 RepID=A0A5B0M2R5_PUCGR|nr:hypothetical protein PGT21_020906 [Puccinia graminis f. sp. tritici]